MPRFLRSRALPPITGFWRKGLIYRLPTSAEWEYACRAGTTTFTYAGDDAFSLRKIANIADRSFKQKTPIANWTLNWDDGFPFAAPVGNFEPNAFGLHDMMGNLIEWCSDFYNETYYASSPTDDPQGPATGSQHVMRSGSYYWTPPRSAEWGMNLPDWRGSLTGFRIVREIPTASKLRQQNPTAQTDNSTSRNSERAVAEWVLKVGGWIETGDGKFTQDQKLLRSGQFQQSLPAGPIRIKSVFFVGKVKSFKESEFELLGELRFIKTLDLGRTGMTNGGLIHIGRLKTLEGLFLFETQVTDQGLDHLKGLQNLKLLTLNKTTVTDQGVATLKASLPGCEIKN